MTAVYLHSLNIGIVIEGKDAKITNELDSLENISGIWDGTLEQMLTNH